MFSKFTQLDSFLEKGESIKFNFNKIDLIYTFSGNEAGCCIANDCKINYGIRSDYAKHRCKKHATMFVDNVFHNYNHQKHLEIVREIKPKYCTVRDVMTKEQCERDNIEYYSPEQILEWAEELNQYAENVIVIPKNESFLKYFDWNKFVCGIPVPSSYGADMLKIENYRNKKCHLLGGSWAKQLSLVYALNENIVSLDNNYIHKIAQNGCYIDPSGQIHNIKTTLNFMSKNTKNICLSISLGAMRYAIDNLANTL